MSDTAAGGEGAPRRVVGRWGEALLAPDAPQEVAQEVLAANEEIGRASCRERV